MSKKINNLSFQIIFIVHIEFKKHLLWKRFKCSREAYTFSGINNFSNKFNYHSAHWRKQDYFLISSTLISAHKSSLHLFHHQMGGNSLKTLLFCKRWYFANSCLLYWLSICNLAPSELISSILLVPLFLQQNSHVLLVEEVKSLEFHTWWRYLRAGIHLLFSLLFFQGLKPNWSFWCYFLCSLD